MAHDTIQRWLIFRLSDGYIYVEIVLANFFPGRDEDIDIGVYPPLSP